MELDAENQSLQEFDNTKYGTVHQVVLLRTLVVQRNFLFLYFNFLFLRSVSAPPSPLQRGTWKNSVTK
jgi:hypothetical protein